MNKHHEKTLATSENSFGEILRQTGSMANANPFRFSTKYQDDETDLLYYGYRYYDVGTGRWNSRDPLGEHSFVCGQARVNRKNYNGFYLKNFRQEYVFVFNQAVDQADRVGLDVYRVTTSELCLTPLHRKIVGDDGAGGCYTIEFFGKKCWYSLGGGGYFVLARGEVYYQHFGHSAAEEIKEKQYREAEKVETTDLYYYPGNLSVDSALAADAAKIDPSDFGVYVFIFHDCGTFANTWMLRARQSVIDAKASWPGFPPSW